MSLPPAEITWAQIAILVLLAVLASGAIPALLRRRPLTDFERRAGLLFGLLIAAVVLTKLMPSEWWPWSAIGVALCIGFGAWVASVLIRG